MRLSITIFCVAVCLLGVQSYRDYSNYKVLKVIPRDARQAKYLMTLEAREQIEIVNGLHLNHPAYVIVAPGKLAPNDLEFLFGLETSIHIENVQRGIDEERQRLEKRYAADPYSFDLLDFNTYEAVMKQLEKWVDMCPTGLVCTLYNIGKSVEGRDLKMLKVTKSGASNPAFWLDSAIHPREWLSLATLQNVMNHVFEDYGTDSEVKSLVDSYDLYFMPIMNPDGYVFTFTDERLWRKNRKVYSGTSCIGTDLNRNFDIRDWGKEGVSHWVCMDTYCGPSPGSEVETKAIQDEIDRILAKQKMAAYVSYHCFGNMWVFPPGSTKDHAGKECNVSPIRDQLMTVTNAGVDALEATHGREGLWLRGGICEVIYPVTGSSGEYAAEKGVTYTYTLELRGDWFIVDKSEIKPSYEEVWNGMIAMIKKIEETS